MKTRRKRKDKNWKYGGGRSSTDEDGKKKVQKEGTEEITEWWFFFFLKAKRVVEQEGNSTEGRKCKWEIFPGSRSKTGRCWSLSLSREHRKKDERREKKEETERSSSLHSPPATDSETRLCTQTSCCHTQQIQSSSVMIWTPLIQSRMQPGCSWRCLQSAAGGTASVSHTTESGTWGNPTWLPVPPNDGWTSVDGFSKRSSKLMMHYFPPIKCPD